MIKFDEAADIWFVGIVTLVGSCRLATRHPGSL